MVNKDSWDADERNKKNDLQKYLEALTRHQQQMIKGITSKHAWKYLNLEEQDFRHQLEDSLTLIELSKLSKEEKRFRSKLIEEVMAVWRRNQTIIKEGKKDLEQKLEYQEEKAAEKWTPRHHEPTPIDRDKTYSVTEASRLHKAKNVSVVGVISGIQPLRKMIKGLSVKCLKCNQLWEIKYAIPGFTESRVAIEHINKCPGCDTGDYLGPFDYENINAVVIELKDCDTFSEIDPLRIVVFGDDEPAFDNTRNIEKHIGETIVVTGDIYSIDIGKSARDRKVVAYLYVKYLIKYLSKQELELTAEDVKAIKRFVAYIGPDKIVDKLSEMLAASVIGYNYVKKGILLTAASTTLDKTLKKLHSLLVGDPGLAKSELLKAGVKIVPNSRYESVQFATGKSLTAIVTKEEGDALILRIGPIPQAKGAIAALNEISRMTHEDQGLLLDTMQEQDFTTNKFGQNFHIDAPTAIIASANPVGGSWKSYESDDTRIDLDKIPMIKPLIDRFPFIFVFKDNRDKEALEEYADKKSNMEDRPAPDYTPYIIKHIMYAKQRYPKPRFSEEAKYLLIQYYVNIRASYGSPRILNTIFEIAKNIARLKLKQEVDATDAEDAMMFYNYILLQLDKVVSLPSNPKDIVFEQCLEILRESRFPMSFEELIKRASERNPQVDRYIGKIFKLEYNKRLRPILDMLRNHSRIKEVQMRPVVLQYIHDEQPEVMVKAGKQTSDHSDHLIGTSNKNEKNISERETDIHGNYSRSKDTETECEKYYSDNLRVSEAGSDRSDKSDRSNSAPFRCYHCEKEGIIFEASNENEYQKHGALKHSKNPLLYPSEAEMKKYGLNPQGKSWENY